MKKTKTIGASNNHCKNCGKRLHWKEHAKITEARLKQPYYFKKWEVCVNGCHSVWHHEEFKVWNKNEKAAQIKNYQEINEQMDFIRNIQ